MNPSKREHAEKLSLRIVGWCFIALAVYVSVDAVSSLLNSEAPNESWIGIALAGVSIAVMPLLARAKRKVAGQIGSTALTADAKQSQLCTYLSVILLAGLLLNALLGWWWADPVAALAMVPIIGSDHRQRRHRRLARYNVLRFLPLKNHQRNFQALQAPPGKDGCGKVRYTYVLAEANL